jgi:hypothetical protein
MTRKIKYIFNLSRLHRAFGLIAFLFLTVVTVTGFLLMNPHWFASDVSPKTALYGRNPEGEYGLWVGTQSGLFFQSVDQSDPIRVDIDYPPSPVIGLVYAPDLIVAFEDPLILAFEPPNWREIALPDSVTQLYDIRFSSNQLVVSTDQGVFGYQHMTWQLLVPSSQNTAMSWIKKIHSGYFISDWMRDLFKWLAIITMGLIVSGILLLFKRFRRS